MPRLETQDISDMVLLSAWRRIPFLSPRSRKIPSGMGAQVQRPALLTYTVGLFGLGMFVLLILLLTNTISNDYTTLEAWVMGIFGTFFCFFCMWVGFKDSVGMSYIEYRDRAEYRRFWRRKSIFYDDITDFAFRSRLRGDGYALVVTNHPDGLADGRISAEQRAAAGITPRVRAEESTTIVIYPFTVSPGVMYAHVLMLLESTCQPDDFASFVRFHSDAFAGLPTYILWEAFDRLYRRTGVALDSERILYWERYWRRVRNTPFGDPDAPAVKTGPGDFRLDNTEVRP